jgi:signal transduction histidine kinase
VADFSAAVLIGEHGQDWHADLAWIDPAEGVCKQKRCGREEMHTQLADAVDRVLARGQIEFLQDLAPENGRACLHPIPPWLVVLPLAARGRTLGAIALDRGSTGRHSAPDDLTLVKDLARRSGIAIDNGRLYREVQEADRRKNEFLAMLAHELRNPLAPILNAVEILRLRGPGDETLQTQRELIDRQVRHMKRLLEDLLDVSRITRGKIQLRREPVDLADVLTQAIEASRPLIDSKAHQLSIRLPHKRVRVDADQTRLAQVFTNLLNNAAKYTDSGGQIRVEAEDPDCGTVRVRVSDTGIGMTPEVLAQAFELFTQADRSLARSQGGLGIGLTLVRSLVEMHGGRVQAFSEGPGKGTEIVVQLPVLPDWAPEKVVPPEEQKPLPTVAGSRILVVDDSMDAAKSLALLLRLAGHEVAVAHDGPTALKTADSFQPNLVILDIGLPGMDGYEVARLLRGQPPSPNLVLVALTGYGQEEDRRLSREAGFDHHLVKPVDPTELQRILVGST